MRHVHERSIPGFILSLVLLGQAAAKAADAPSLVCLPQDDQTCLVLSPSAAQELVSGHNAYGDDIRIHLQRVSSEETNRTLRSLEIVATRASTGEPVPDFSFENPVQLRLGHWALFQNSNGAPNQTTYTSISDPLQWLGVYWNNGQAFVRLSGVSLDADQSLCLNVRSLGRYQVILTRSASTLALSRGSPYPRIITPNAHFNRRAFFFVDTPSPETVSGTIYDFQGLKVRDLQVDASSPAPNALVWDGRDGGGNVVPSGPYLYTITDGDQHVSGSLVVAR